MRTAQRKKPAIYLKVIIEELGEAGQGLNAQNITNWLKGGYQDYLQQQADLDRARAQIEIGLELQKEFTDADIDSLRRACHYVTALQLFEALRDHGDQALKGLFETRPRGYLNVIHTLCRQSNTTLKVDKFRSRQQLQLAALSGSSPIKVIQASAKALPERGWPQPQQSSDDIVPLQQAVNLSPQPSPQLPAGDSSPFKPIQAPAAL